MVTSICGCKESTLERDESAMKVDDTLVTVVSETNLDANGCLASAGYIWSLVKQDCVNINDASFQLYSVDQSMQEKKVFLLMDSTTLKAEVFLPNSSESILLQRSDDTLPWIYENWSLELTQDEYILKYKKEILYKGDLDFGPKITGKIEE